MRAAVHVAEEVGTGLGERDLLLGRLPEEAVRTPAGAKDDESCAQRGPVFPQRFRENDASANLRPIYLRITELMGCDNAKERATTVRCDFQLCNV